MRRPYTTVLLLLISYLSIAATPRDAEPVILDLYGRGVEQMEAGTLQDFYKLHYQAFFGAEHLAPDTASVLRYLDYELQTMEPPLTPDIQDIGGFYRVSLTWVQQGRISPQALAYAFISSAQPIPHQRGEWYRRWRQVERAVLKRYPQLSDAKLQRELRYAARQNAAVRHSAQYRDYYHPHYRIIRADVWQQYSDENVKQNL